jgi:peptidyl-prolyl cis-trans isomerase C
MVHIKTKISQLIFLMFLAAHQSYAAVDLSDAEKIKEFQRSQGIPDTGVLNQKTRDALKLLELKENNSRVTSAHAIKKNEDFVIDQSLLDLSIRANVENGAVNNDTLKNTIKEELVTRELMYQRAVDMKLDQDPVAKALMEQARKMVLVDMLIDQHLKKNPIAPAAINAEYKRQIDLVKDAEEFNIQMILVRSKDTADEAQKKVNAGEDFEKLASVYSTDNSKSNGGNVGWVLSTALIPQVSNVVVNLPKGVSTKQPIQTPNGWHIIKIVDKRPFQLPANLNQKEEKEKIAVLLKQQKRAEFIQSIRAARK